MIAFYTTLMIVATLTLVGLALRYPGGARRQIGLNLCRVVLLGCTVFSAVMLMIDGAAPVFPDADSSAPVVVDRDVVGTDVAVVAGATPTGVGVAGSLATS